MNYIQKNKRTILLIASGLVVLVALIIWALQNKEYGSEDVIASVYPISVNVGEPINYEEKSPFGETRKWIFSDGKESMEKKGTHMYDKPGYYQISMTLDNKFTKTFNILVSAAPEQPEDAVRNPTLIDAPTQARQLENVLFRAISDDAKTYTWKFGESGIIDANGKMASYAFKKSGNYLVTLYTDTDEDPINHQIQILPAYPEDEELEKLSPIIMQSEVYDKINDDFRYHLQQIANGSNFNFHYNYLKKTYLCNKDNVSLTSNERNTSFYYYCTGLQFDKNNLIQEVKTTVDTEQNCVTKVEVKQSKQ
ncbi:MAG: PKD domain-containing protein [Flavobacteriales bacterium]